MSLCRTEASSSLDTVRILQCDTSIVHTASSSSAVRPSTRGFRQPHRAAFIRERGPTHMGSAALGEAIKGIRDWSMQATPGQKPAQVGETFGSLVFNDRVQQTRLPKPVYKSLRATVTRGVPLDISTADAVATALKDWAV